MGGIDALFPRGRFDDSHATWCVHPVGDANNAIKHVSRATGAAFVAFLNGKDRSPNLAVLATEVLITKGHMNQDEVQAIRDALDAEVVVHVMTETDREVCEGGLRAAEVAAHRV